MAFDTFTVTTQKNQSVSELGFENQHAMKVDDFGHWLSGFVDGEGCFFLRVNRGGPVASLMIALRADDSAILYSICSYLGCGSVIGHKLRVASGAKTPMMEFKVGKIADLFHRIAPHFERYPLRAKKARDFRIWKEAVDLCWRVRQRRRHRRSLVGRAGGLLPKWTSEERAHFVTLMETLRQTRRFNSQVVAIPTSQVQPTLFDALD